MERRDKSKRRISKKFIFVIILVGTMAAASGYSAISNLVATPQGEQLSIGIKNNHCLSKTDKNGTITGFAIYPEMQKAIKDAIPSNMTVQNFLMYKEAQDFLKVTCAKYDVSNGQVTPKLFNESMVYTDMNSNDRHYRQVSK